MSKEENKQELQQILANSDAWVRQFGILTDYSHNTIIINLYSLFPRIKYLEYFIDKENKSMTFFIYMNIWYLLWILILKKYKKLQTEIEKYLKAYTNNTYTIRIRFKRYYKQGNL